MTKGASTALVAIAALFVPVLAFLSFNSWDKGVTRRRWADRDLEEAKGPISDAMFAYKIERASDLIRESGRHHASARIAPLAWTRSRRLRVSVRGDASKALAAVSALLASAFGFLSFASLEAQQTSDGFAHVALTRSIHSRTRVFANERDAITSMNQANEWLVESAHHREVALRSAAGALLCAVIALLAWFYCRWRQRRLRAVEHQPHERE
jgi:hypothetical protein